MKMRRVLVEVLVAADEFESDAKLTEALEMGIQENIRCSRFDVLVLKSSDVIDFDDAKWARLKSTKL